MKANPQEEKAHFLNKLLFLSFFLSFFFKYSSRVELSFEVRCYTSSFHLFNSFIFI